MENFDELTFRRNNNNKYYLLEIKKTIKRQSKGPKESAGKSHERFAMSVTVVICLKHLLNIASVVVEKLL